MHRLRRTGSNGVAGLHPRLHVGKAVLECLVRRQRTAEGEAVSHVFDGELEHAVGRTRALGALQRERELQLALDVTARAANRAHRRGRRDRCSVETDGGEALHEVEALERLDDETG